MEKLHYIFKASKSISRQVHVGVVSSGDLEIIIKPTLGSETKVSITTGSDGFGDMWVNVLERFFSRYPIIAEIEINDFGATPGVVSLRLAQAVEVVLHER